MTRLFPKQQRGLWCFIFSLPSLTLPAETLSTTMMSTPSPWTRSPGPASLHQAPPPAHAPPVRWPPRLMAPESSSMGDTLKWSVCVCDWILLYVFRSQFMIESVSPESEEGCWEGNNPLRYVSPKARGERESRYKKCSFFGVRVCDQAFTVSSWL